ncbi:MAG: hypothetical protein AB7N80_11660 [Bdellovibrionales bacterium]
MTFKSLSHLILLAALTGAQIALASPSEIPAFAAPRTQAVKNTVSKDWVLAQVKNSGTGVGNSNLSRQNLSTPDARGQALANFFNMERYVSRAHDRLRNVVYGDRRAAFESYIHGAPDQAFCTLRAAMLNAFLMLPNGPMTKIVLNRGLELANALNANNPHLEPVNCAAPSDQATLIRKTRAGMMFDWIKLAIEVSETFDKKYYLPYRFLYNRCAPNPDHCDDYNHRAPEAYRDFDYREFELESVRLAGKQLSTLQKGFSLQGPYGTVPFGSLKMVLVAITSLSDSVAADMLNNMYMYAFHKGVVQLHSLACYLRDSHYSEGGIRLFRFAMKELGEATDEFESGTFNRCDKDCADNNDWVTPDEGWVAPSRPGRTAPGFVDKNDDGDWVAPHPHPTKRKRP